MDRLGKLLFLYGIGMAFFEARHLVVRRSVQFVVRYRSRFGLELVQREYRVVVGDFLHIQRIGRIVDQYIRVASDIDHVDHVVLGILRIVGQTI